MALLVLCNNRPTINADDYIFRPRNVVVFLGEDITLSCQLEDNNDLNWIIKGMIFDPSDESLNKKYSIVNDGSLLITSVGLDDVGLYDCHSTKSLIHSYAHVDLLISEPTCQSNKNEYCVCCSFVYSGNAVTRFELYDSLGRNLHAGQMKPDLKRTETSVSFKADIKRGDDSLLYTFKVSFVHESNDQDKLEVYPSNGPERIRTFSMTDFFQNSKKSSIQPELHQASDPAYNCIAIALYLPSLIFAVIVAVSVHLFFKVRRAWASTAIGPL